jgi:undecaprenyl-diphosphatase
MSTRRSVAAALALLGLVAVGGVFVWRDPLHPPFQGVDESWLALMRSTRSGILTGVALVLDVAGGVVVAVLATVALAAYLLARRAWPLAGFLLAATVGTRLLTFLVKLLTARQRPGDPLGVAGGYSYPSGHVSATTALTVAVALILWHFVRSRLGVLLAVVAATAMAWDRTYLGVHWLSDTFAGAALGTGVTLLAWAAFAPMLGRRRGALPVGVSPAAGSSVRLPGGSAVLLPGDLNDAPPPDR